MRITLPVARMVPIHQAALNPLRKKVVVPDCKVVTKDRLDTKLALQIRLKALTKLMTKWRCFFSVSH